MLVFIMLVYMSRIYFGTYWVSYIKYGIVIYWGNLFVWGDSWHDSILSGIVMISGTPYLFTSFYSVCLEKTCRDRLCVSALRSGFPSWLNECRGSWDWLVGCAEFPLSDSRARKPRRSLIWLVAAFSKYEFGCSTVSPLRTEEERPITV